MTLQKTLWILWVLAAAQGCGATRRYVIERDRGNLDEEANTSSTSDPRWKIARAPAAETAREGDPKAARP
jgi:predicted neuraminidase